MKINKSNYKPAKQHAVLTTGEVIKMLRELKGWTQEELSKYCSINAKNIVNTPFLGLEPYKEPLKKLQKMREETIIKYPSGKTDKLNLKFQPLSPNKKIHLAQKSRESFHSRTPIFVSGDFGVRHKRIDFLCIDC
ncbi:MAG: hypothetical protein ABIK15_03980 [Pseudomonadota bacterium]